MKAPMIAAAIAALSMTALAQPAAACPNGYERVQIQGHSICKIKTPKLGLKAKQAVQPGASKQAIRTQPARR